MQSSSLLYTHAAASYVRQCLFWLQFLLVIPKLEFFASTHAQQWMFSVKYLFHHPHPKQTLSSFVTPLRARTIGTCFSIPSTHHTRAHTYPHTNTQVPATLAYSFLRPNFSHTVVGIAYTGSMVLKPGKPSSDKPANPKYVWNISAIFPGRSEMPPSSWS